MNKKGFTLIELLAVIVILAIVALIATPVVMNIIADSKNSTTEVNTKMYLKATEQAIARQNLNGAFNPEYCVIQSNGNLICGSINLKIDIDGTKPISGSIYFKNGKVESYTLEYGNGKIQTSGSICKGVTAKTKTTGNVPEGKYELGDEYICEVKPGIKYHFFVVSTGKYIGTSNEYDPGVINLIMDRNINSGGGYANESDKGLTTWGVAYRDESDWKNGEPTIAMQFLNSATKSWNDQILVRLPKDTERCTELWATNYLHYSNYNTDKVETIPGIYGYWTSVFHPSAGAEDAWVIGYDELGYEVSMIDISSKYGVRPVISVPISLISE